MRSTLFLCSLLGAGIAAAEFKEAPIEDQNPEGVTYTATLPDKASTELRGSISGTAGPGGEGVIFSVDFYGFPDEKEYGPFSYHIHDQPVPEDGNCTKTLAHLDPFARGEDPPCDKDDPATCQIGDLSGKYGSISDVANGKHFKAEYHDLYSSTRPGPAAFFGNRSVVVHMKNKTRISCANFMQEPSYPGGNTTVAPTGVYPTGAPSPTITQFPGSAARVGAGAVGVIVAGVAALVL
ncbi:hypothetical protein FQN50_002418 [Emmonsiellopsis sp. PD_5]|nr:hypothetical protein FQN50_002418 [Emmonsiellopsis sp. PD_5]